MTNSKTENIKSKWEEWNKGGGPKYPHEKVIQFTFRNYNAEKRSHSHALDLGCGTGTNSFFLANEGFDISVCDISETGVEATKNRLSTIDVVPKLAQAIPISQIDFPKDTFDYIICIGVLDSAGLEESKAALQKVYSILKKEGKAIFVFASNEDFRILENNPYQIHGYSEEEVNQIFTPFDWNFLHIDRYITTFEGKRIKSDDFLVTLQK